MPQTNKVLHLPITTQVLLFKLIVVLQGSSLKHIIDQVHKQGDEWILIKDLTPITNV